MKTLRHRRKRRGDFITNFIFVASDSLAIAFAFALAYLMHFDFFPYFRRHDRPDPLMYLMIFPLVLGIFLMTFRQRRIYMLDILRRRLDEIGLIFKAVALASLVVMAATFLYRDFSYSRIVFFLHFMLSFIFIVLFLKLSTTIVSVKLS